MTSGEAAYESEAAHARLIAEAGLTEMQRAALELRLRHGFGWKRAGMTLGVDPSTVRGHYAAAVRKLERAAERIGLDVEGLS